jgi:hypothetical protein
VVTARFQIYASLKRQKKKNLGTFKSKPDHSPITAFSRFSRFLRFEENWKISSAQLNICAKRFALLDRN